MIRRVCVVTPEYPGCGPSHGIGRVSATLADALTAAGIEVLVLASTDTGRFRIRGVRVDPCGPSDGPFLWRPLLSQAWLDHEIAAFDPDIVEGSNWGGLTACLARQDRCILRLSTSTALIPGEGLRRRLLRPLHLAWERRAVRRCRRLIADSQVMAEQARRLYRRSSDAIISHAHAAAISDADPDARDLLFVGRLEARKGVDVLLAAWQAIADRHRDRRLHLVGRDAAGFGKGSLARWPAANVVVHGPLADGHLAALRRRCAVQVVPSRFESFGLVVLEAWAGGQVVVASDQGALPEVIGEAGLCTSLDAGGLAAALDRILGDPVLAHTLRGLGRHRLRERHDPLVLARRTLAAYHGGDA